MFAQFSTAHSVVYRTHPNVSRAETYTAYPNTANATFSTTPVGLAAPGVSIELKSSGDNGRGERASTIGGISTATATIRVPEGRLAGVVVQMRVIPRSFAVFAGLVQNSSVNSPDEAIREPIGAFDSAIHPSVRTLSDDVVLRSFNGSTAAAQDSVISTEDGFFVELDLGDIVNINSNGTALEYLQVSVPLLVLDRNESLVSDQYFVEANVSYSILAGRAVEHVGATSTNITVQEPNLGVSEFSVATFGGLAAGDVIPLNLTIAHLSSSTSDAFAMELFDANHLLDVAYTFIGASTNHSESLAFETGSIVSLGQLPVEESMSVGLSLLVLPGVEMPSSFLPDLRVRYFSVPRTAIARSYEATPPSRPVISTLGVSLNTTATSLGGTGSTGTAAAGSILVSRFDVTVPSGTYSDASVALRFSSIGSISNANVIKLQI